jgi:hypothetical protein
MISKQGETLQGVGLTQGNIQVTSGVFLDATTFHCHANGTVEFTWVDDSKNTYPFVAGDSFPLRAKSIKVVTGTFSIGFD